MKFNPLRKLACTNEYQVLFANGKKFGFKIFNNVEDLTPLQVTFLNWIQIYDNILRDIAMNEKYATPELLDDVILCDAYLTYKRKKRIDKDFKEDKLEGLGDGSIVFK